jgi:cell division protein FtsI/penicillin-binding protein 2
MDIRTKLKYGDRIANIIVNNYLESTITVQFQDNKEIKTVSRRVADTLQKIITPEDEAIDGLLNLRQVNLKVKSIYEHVRTKDLVYLHTIENDMVTYYTVEKIKTKSNGTIYDMTIDNESFAQLNPYSFTQSYKFYL